MKIIFKNLIFYLLGILLSITVLNSCKKNSYWLKGNMHTHTFWSDGTNFPESVATWYKNNGYDFLVFTDHNTLHEPPAKTNRVNHALADGKLWVRIVKDHPALADYLALFGNTWVKTRNDEEEGYIQVHLKTFEEFRSLYEKTGEFLVIAGNEITNPHRVHLLSFDQEKAIPPSKGSENDRVRMIRETVDKVNENSIQSGRNNFPALAHPNHGWAITAEMIIDVPELRFFEVYNGIPSCNNDGDGYRAGTGKIWDIVLANRLGSENGELLYGLATDDAHHYHGQGSGPGRGWVMVRSESLSSEAIFSAMDRGDFYSSTGVIISNFSFNGKTFKIEIEPMDGIEYITEFIGTRKGFDGSSVPTLDSLGMEIENTTRTYSDKIGEILASNHDLNSSYTFSGDELYIRAVVTSTADQIDPVSGKVLGKQKAWLQPVRMGEK